MPYWQIHSYVKLHTSGGWLASVMLPLTDFTGIWEFVFASVLFVVAWTILRMEQIEISLVHGFIFDLTIPLQYHGQYASMLLCCLFSVVLTSSSSSPDSFQGPCSAPWALLAPLYLWHHDWVRHLLFGASWSLHPSGMPEDDDLVRNLAWEGR